MHLKSFAFGQNTNRLVRFVAALLFNEQVFTRFFNLLILPGVLSDVLGLVFIFPPTRYIVSTYMARSWMKSQRMWVRVGSMGNFGGFYTAYRTHQTHTQRPPERSFEDVIEVDAVDVREISADLPIDAGKDSSSES